MPSPQTTYPHFRKSDCIKTDSGIDPRCAVHGGVWSYAHRACQTVSVLEEVFDERANQFSIYGTNEDLEFGTGFASQWLRPYTDESAFKIEIALRRQYETTEAVEGKPSFMQLLREEFSEAMLEDEPDSLRAELIQVAAVAVSWIEKIDVRRAKALAAVDQSQFQSIAQSGLIADA